MIETLEITSPPAVMPVSVATMLTQCRVDPSDTDAATLMPGYIAAATNLVEKTLKMSLINRSYAWTIDYFPNRIAVSSLAALFSLFANSRLYPYTYNQVLFLPKPPIISVDSVVYMTPDGTTTTLDPSAYVVTPGIPGRLAPSPGSIFPNTASTIGGITINLTCGFGSSPSSLPPEAVQAITLEAADWYVSRENTSSEGGKPIGCDSKRLLNCLKYGFYV